MLALFDFNNLAMRNFLGSSSVDPKGDPQYGLWKYFIFNSIYYSLTRFKNIDEVVVAYDDKNSWRKVIYPIYKQTRKKDEEIDWDEFFRQYYLFLEDLKKYTPIKVIHVSRAEADDIIGILSRQLSKEKIVISSDKDYKQLCDVANVYDPMKQEFFDYEDPERFMTKLSLIGQKKDNVLNVKTPLDWPEGKRKPAFGEKMAEKVIDKGLDEFLDQPISYDFETEEGRYTKTIYPRERFNTNKTILDFHKIPQIISNKTMEKYNEYDLPEPDNMRHFFERQGWPNYLDNIDKVENILMRLY